MSAPVLAGEGVSPAKPTSSAAAILEAWQSAWSEAARAERRCEPRHRVSAPLDLIPLSAESFTPIGSALRVECRDVSKSGFRICHREPLIYKTVGLVFPYGVDADTLWVTRLKWCRFTRDGTYESGGLILRALPWINGTGEPQPEQQNDLD